MLASIAHFIVNVHTHPTHLSYVFHIHSTSYTSILHPTHPSYILHIHLTSYTSILHPNIHLTSYTSVLHPTHPSYILHIHHTSFTSIVHIYPYTSIIPPYDGATQGYILLCLKKVFVMCVLVHSRWCVGDWWY